MNQHDLSPEATLWSDAGHAPLAEELMNLMGSSLKPIAVGGSSTTEVNDLAKSLGCERYDDLRKMLVDRPASFLLLTSLEGVTQADLDTATNQDTVILTLEPIADDLQTLARQPKAPGSNSEHSRGLLIPAFTQSPGFLQAAEPNELLGDQKTLTFSSVGKPMHGSLFARLLDAWQTVLGFTLMPETIDASLVGPLTEPPQGLREMTGSLSAHARVSGACSALLYVSDHAGLSQRELMVSGEQGTLRVNDTGYSLINPAGEPIDEPSENTESPQTGGFTDLLAFQWRKLLDRTGFVGPTPSGQVQTEALACCLACLLSVRTGQPESPGKVLQMNR